MAFCPCNMGIQFVFQKTPEGRGECVNIEGSLINNLRFADDTVIMAECEEDIQILLERVNRENRNIPKEIY